MNEEAYVKEKCKTYTERQVLAILNRITRHIYFHPEKIGTDSFYKNAIGMHFFFVEEWFKLDNLREEE